MLAAATSHLSPDTPVEIWFEDAARIGQKNGLARLWARKGTRPRQPKDQRYHSAFLFGAICPARNTGAALVLPAANTEAMQAHLKVIAGHIAKGACAVLRLGRAAWHTTRRLKIAANIIPIHLPSRAPELNPFENVWQFLRQNWLSNRLFDSYEAILDAASDAWNRLLKLPS
jgi:hypothetical protein